MAEPAAWSVQYGRVSTTAALPAPDALYVAFTNAVPELFCGMTPAEASAAARANPGTTAGVIRFR